MQRRDFLWQARKFLVFVRPLVGIAWGLLVVVAVVALSSTIDKMAAILPILVVCGWGIGSCAGAVMMFIDGHYLAVKHIVVAMTFLLFHLLLLALAVAGMVAPVFLWLALTSAIIGAFDLAFDACVISIMFRRTRPRHPRRRD